MKCPDCNGVIEGRRSFCPHCGRKFGSGLKLRSELFSSTASPSVSKPNDRPNSSHPGRNAGAARHRREQIRNAGEQWSSYAPIARIIIFAMIGAIIGGLLPGNRWIGGAMIGLFLGLPRKKKS